MTFFLIEKLIIYNKKRLNLYLIRKDDYYLRNRVSDVRVNGDLLITTGFQVLIIGYES